MYACKFYKNGGWNRFCNDSMHTEAGEKEKKFALNSVVPVGYRASSWNMGSSSIPELICCGIKILISETSSPGNMNTADPQSSQWGQPGPFQED